MASLSNPAEMRSLIVQRLLGSAEAGQPHADASLAKLAKSFHAQLLAALREGISKRLELELISCHPLPMQEWLKSVEPASWLILACNSDDDPAPLFLNLDAQSISLVTTMALGGDAAPNEGRGELSDLEAAFLQLVAELAMPALQDLRAGSPLKAVLRQAGGMDRRAFSEGPAAVLAFRINCGEAAGGLQVAFAQEPGKQNREGRNSAAASTWKSHLSGEIGRSRLTVEAVADLGPYPLSALKSLRVGDVIPIPPGNLRSCTLTARGEPVHTGGLGRLGDVYSFKISAPAHRGGSLAGSSGTTTGRKTL